jgi:glycosyltransferase involved in cell wall biosynthesis
MKALVVVSQLSPYIWQCIQRLADADDVVVRVVSIQFPTIHGFDVALFADANVMVEWWERNPTRSWSAYLREWRPSVALVGGWFLPELRECLNECYRRDIRCLMLSDTPIVSGKRDALRRAVKTIYLRRRCDAIMVPGERAALQAERLGFSRHRQLRPLYCIDLSLYGNDRSESDPPHFLFAGRWAAEKNVQCLLEAYALYRKSVAEPWPLRLVGPIREQDKTALNKLDGVSHAGMLQPRDLRSALSRASAFVLPSTFDPWPVALLEAAASGLPLLASWCCGSAVELLVDGVNGYRFDPFSPSDLARALTGISARGQEPSKMGEMSRQIAAGFDTRRWAEVVRGWLNGQAVPRC